MPLLNLQALERDLGVASPILEAVLTIEYLNGRSRPFTEVDGERVILPKTVRVDIVDGAPVEEVDALPTPEGCYARVTVQAKTGARAQYYRKVLIPDVPGPIDFGDLEQVDPATLLPYPDAPTAQQVLAAAESAVSDAETAAALSGSSAFSAGASAAAAQGSEDAAAAIAASVIPTTDAAMTAVAANPASAFATGLSGTIAVGVNAGYTSRQTDYEPREFLTGGDAWDTAGDTAMGYAIAAAGAEAHAAWLTTGDADRTFGVPLDRGKILAGGTDIAIHMGVDYKGAGIDSTVILGASTDGSPVMQFTTNLSANGVPPGIVSMRDFTVDGRYQRLPSYATEPKGISGSGAKRVRVHSVRAQNTLATGLAFDHATDLVMIGPEAWNCGRNIGILGLDPRAVSGHSGIGIGVGRDYTADRTITDASIANGGKTVTSATAAFNAADVGATVRIGGAGPSSSSLLTTIVALTSATIVQVADASSATISGGTIVINGGRPYIDDNDSWAAGLQQHQIIGFVAVGNGRAGLFYERTVSTNPYTKGLRASGFAAYNAFGVFDNGTWGAEYDVKSLYNHINGVRLDSTILSTRQGSAGRLRGEVAFNGTGGVADSANIWIGAQVVGSTTPDGYEFDVHAHDSIGGPNVGSDDTSVWARGLVFRGKSDKAAGSGFVIRGRGTGPNGEIEDLTITAEADNNGTDATQTYKDGITIVNAHLSRPRLTGTARGNAGYGYQTSGYNKYLDRATITLDLDGNTVGPYRRQHSLSADSVDAPLHGTTTDPSALRVTFEAPTSVGLSWTAPIPATGITDYAVQYRTKDVGSGAGSWTTFSHTASTAPTITVTGLTTNTVYEFRVAKIDGSGTGTYTAGPVATGPVTVGDAYADNFGTAGTMVAASAADGVTAATWAVVNFNGQTSGAMTKASGKVKATAGSGGVAATINCGSINGSVHATIPTLNGAAAYIGVIARATSASVANCISARVRTSGGVPVYRIYKTVSGVETQLDAGGLPTPVAGDVIRLAFNGSALNFYVNGASVWTGTEASQAVSGHTYHGILGNVNVDNASELDAWGYNVNPV
jgi:hypothetical protein